MYNVFLGIGHGGKDPGAVYGSLKEKTINLQIGLACRSELVRHGVGVVMSRTTDENDPVSEEVKEANACNCDLAFDIHVNAGGGDGFEAFCNKENEDGVRLAKLCEKYVREIGQNSRGIKDGMHLRFINGTNMTAVLTECAFIDNTKDNKIIDTLAEQQKLGVAYAKAILEYFGIKYKEKETPKKETTAEKLYYVKCGAYKEKANADKMVKKLKAAGFDAYITT